jgi:hypothetical protein
MPDSVEPADHAVKVASTRGYKFNAADVQAYYDQQRARAEKGELPDWELEAVAGGAANKGLGGPAKIPGGGGGALNIVSPRPGAGTVIGPHIPRPKR